MKHDDIKTKLIFTVLKQSFYGITYIKISDGTVTPPTNYDVLSLEERSNIFHQVCGVITAASKKICTRSTKCPLHTETQRREVRNRWLTVDDDHVDIDRYFNKSFSISLQLCFELVRF